MHNLKIILLLSAMALHSKAQASARFNSCSKALHDLPSGPAYSTAWEASTNATTQGVLKTTASRVRSG